MTDPAPPAARRSEPLLELSGARVVRDGHTILEVDRLIVAEGERVALVGPNGSGKSTLVGVLTRDVLPIAHQDGSPAVRLLGRERWGLFEARELFGLVSSSLQSDYGRRVTVRDTVASGFFGSIGLYKHQHKTADMRRRTEDLMAELGITHLAERTMNTLSTGEARRALIARALVNDPPVLVLDEPYAGLDPTARWYFAGTVSELADSGRGLLLVTHHIEDIPPQVTRVIMLRDGRVFADGPKAELLTSERLSDLFGIPAEVEEREGVYRIW
jgi:iron complex transport system ATP-binding protein